MEKINEYGKAEGNKITRFLWDGHVLLHEWASLRERSEIIVDREMDEATPTQNHRSPFTFTRKIAVP